MKYRTPRTPPPRIRESAVADDVAVDAGPGPSRDIPAGEFKARCLALMDEVARTGGQYVITKRGVPVARLLPASLERRPFLGSMKGTVTTLGDIVNPIDEPWEAFQGWADDEQR